jgi:Zn-dependent protease with chaperone function
MTALSFFPPGMAFLTFLTGGRLTRRLPPATVVRLGTLFALTVALMTGMVLSCAAVLTVMRVLTEIAGSGTTAVLKTHTLTSLVVGVVEALVVVVLLTAATTSFVRSVINLWRASSATRRMGPSRAGLIVIDDEVPAAFAVAGIRGRVVVSSGMLRALEPRERSVLLAHEQAHIRHHHHLYTQLALLAAAANPLLRPVARAVQRNTERWADEVAAAEVGDREAVARGLARAALAVYRHGIAHKPGAHPQPACYASHAADAHSADTSTESLLAARIRLLLAPAPHRAASITAAVLAVAVLCGATGGVAIAKGHTEIEKAELILGLDG